MNQAIQTRGLGKRFGRTTALHDLNLNVSRGEVFGLIGPNGAGKTTAMRLLLDLIRPSSGTLTVLGEHPSAGSASLRSRVGYLPGELRLQGRGRAGELLQHYARISGPVAKGAIERLAERLGLDLSREVGKLSKGNKQKVGLIQAFMHEPELLILDEPTSGLDPLVQQEFMQLVRDASANGQTVFLSSHVLSEIEQAADRVGILHRGELIRSGTVTELRSSRQRRVRGTVAQADGLSATLSGLTQVHEVDLREVSGELRFSLLLEGEVDQLIKALARYEVRDLLIEEPELEDTVIELYREPDQ